MRAAEHVGWQPAAVSASNRYAALILDLALVLTHVTVILSRVCAGAASSQA